MYLAKGFGLLVVAEGVETDAQRDYLLGAGCQYAQGYLFSPPVEPAAISALWPEFSTPAGRTSRADGGRSSRPAPVPATRTPAGS